MNIKDAIKERHSVRQFQNVPLKTEDRSRLNEIIEQCNMEGTLHVQLVCDDPACFDTFLAHYGKFKNGIKAAMMAPTALNQQKFIVDLVGDEPVITAKPSPMARIDLGIVKYNFEAASGHKCR